MSQENKEYNTFDGLPDIVEYINTTEAVTIYVEIYGDERERIPKAIHPGDQVLLNEADRRKYSKTNHILSGDLAINSPDLAKRIITRGQNVMNNTQIKYLIEKCPDAQKLEMKVEEITSINTLNRVRKEIIKQDKPYSWISTLDKVMAKIMKEETNLKG